MSIPVHIAVAYQAWAKSKGLKIVRPSHADNVGEVSLRCIKGKYKVEIIHEITEEAQLKWMRDDSGEVPAANKDQSGRVRGYSYPIFSGTEAQLTTYFTTGQDQLRQIDAAKGKAS